MPSSCTTKNDVAYGCTRERDARYDIYPSVRFVPASVCVYCSSAADEAGWPASGGDLHSPSGISYHQQTYTAYRIRIHVCRASAMYDRPEDGTGMTYSSCRLACIQFCNWNCRVAVRPTNSNQDHLDLVRSEAFYALATPRALGCAGRRRCTEARLSLGNEVFLTVLRVSDYSTGLQLIPRLFLVVDPPSLPRMAPCSLAINS